MIKKVINWIDDNLSRDNYYFNTDRYDCITNFIKRAESYLDILLSEEERGLVYDHFV